MKYVDRDSRLCKLPQRETSRLKKFQVKQLNATLECS